jgi:PTS system fructose-specific IIC component
VALEVGILTTEVFVAIVYSAVVSSLVVAPWLSWSIRRRKAVNLLDFFLRRAVAPQLASETRWEAIEELCSAVAEHARMPDRDALVAAVRAREEVIGTGTGHGIAIPHARLASLQKPVLTFGRSVPGVDWDAPDGLPVHLVFLLLTPEHEHGLQLQILAAIAAAMGNEEARERVAHAGSAQAMSAALQDALRAQTLARVTT